MSEYVTNLPISKLNNPEYIKRMNEEIDEYEKEEFFLAQNSYNSIPINSNQYVIPLSRNEREISDKQVLLEDCIVEDRNKCTIQLVKYKLNWENNQTQDLDYYGNIENLKSLYKNGSVTSWQKVANFIADKVEVIQCPKDYGYTILLKIYCKVRIGNNIHNREVYISYKDFLEENIRNCFKKADIICFSLDKNVNSLLKEYLNQYIHIDITNYSIPYRSGFFKEILSNDKDKYTFASYENFHQYGSKLLESRHINVNLTFNQYYSTVKNFLSIFSLNKLNMFFNIYRITALVSSLLCDNEIKLNKILVLNTNGIDMSKMLSAYFQIYNLDTSKDDSQSYYRPIESIYLQSSEKDLKSAIIGAKDEVLIFETQKGLSKYKMSKQSDNITLLNDYFIKHRRIEDNEVMCLGVIISDTLKYEALENKENYIFLDIKEEDIAIPNRDYQYIAQVNNDFNKLVIDYVCKHYEVLKIKFSNIEITSDLDIFKLIYEEIILVVLKLYRITSKNISIDNELESYIATLLGDTDTNDEIVVNQDGGIIEQFKDVLNQLIDEEYFEIVLNTSLNRNSNKSNKDKIYYNPDDLILMYPDVFRREIASRVTLCSNDCQLKKVLSRNNLIKLTDGLNCKLKIYEENKSFNMVAIYLKEVISKDNLAKFPLENSTGFIPCHTDDFSIKRIKLGTDDNGYNIYWSLGNLNNKHILLAGRSGSGKSYCICNIIQSLHDLKHNVIILDFSRSYIQSKHNNHPIFDSGVIHNHDLNEILENNSLEIVLDDISNEYGSVNRFALSSQNEDLDTNIKYFLRTLFKYCQEHDSFEITLVIDEIQKINIDINHPLNDIISEGRKFDISLIVATQQLNDLKPKVISKLRDVGTKLIFQTDDTKLSSILDSSKSNTIRELLKGLTVGQCILYGSIEDINHNMTASNNFIKITIPYNID